MALNAEDLKNELVNAIAEKDNAGDAHDAIASVINGYMNSNLQASGSYTGIIAGTPPMTDPLAGSYVFSFSGCNIVKELLMSSAASGVASWLLYIGSCLSLMVSSPSDDNGVLTLTTPLMLAPVVLNADFSSAENYQDSMGILADAIVALFASPSLPIGGTPCESSSGGLGALVPAGFL